MDAETVARLMSFIPERAARTQSGAAFELSSSGCRYPERLAHVAKFLHWLSPLESLSNADQQVLGLRNAAGRPVHAADLEDEELDADLLQAEPEEPLHAEPEALVSAEEITAPAALEEESALA